MEYSINDIVKTVLKGPFDFGPAYMTMFVNASQAFIHARADRYMKQRLAEEQQPAATAKSTPPIPPFLQADRDANLAGLDTDDKPQNKPKFS
jgi:hypothetical protein